MNFLRRCELPSERSREAYYISDGKWLRTLLKMITGIYVHSGGWGADTSGEGKP